MTLNTSGVDLSVQQFVGAWRLMCAGGPGYAAAEIDGVHYVFSGVPIPFFNVAILTDRLMSADTFRARAQQACAWAADRQVPWLCVLTHEALEPGVDAVTIADESGLASMMPMTGMIAQQIAPPIRVPEDLQLTMPDDDAGCAALLDMNSLAYGMDLGAGKDVLGKRSFWNGHYPVLGSAGGTPVSSAAVLMVDGYRYVALVATDPGQQRRGYADATMRRALELSAETYADRPTVLHATDAGRPIYERMGYTPISTHTIFIEKRFLESHA
jgi:GNAT superfamily N-acetyltransferase